MRIYSTFEAVFLNLVPTAIRSIQQFPLWIMYPTSLLIASAETKVEFVEAAGIERVHMTSRRPYWCSKTKKMAAILVYQPNAPGIELFFYTNILFCLVNQNGCCSREWKRSIMGWMYIITTTYETFIFIHSKLEYYFF